MKHFTLVIMAALLFSTLAGSCGKKSDTDMKTDMAKSDSEAGGPPPLPSATITQSTRPGTNTPGISIASGNYITTKATINCTDNGNQTYQFRAFYGTPPSAPDSTASSGVLAAWPAGVFTPLPQGFYPQYMGSGKSPNPATWTNYQTVSIGTASGGTTTATATAAAGSEGANMTISVVAGGGGPGK